MRHLRELPGGADLTNCSCRYLRRVVQPVTAPERAFQTLRRLVCLVVFVAGCGGSENVEPLKSSTVVSIYRNGTFAMMAQLSSPASGTLSGGGAGTATTWAELDDALPLRAPVPRDWDLISCALGQRLSPTPRGCDLCTEADGTPQERLAVSFPWLTLRWRPRCASFRWRLACVLSQRQCVPECRGRSAGTLGRPNPDDCSAAGTTDGPSLRGHASRESKQPSLSLRWDPWAAGDRPGTFG